MRHLYLILFCLVASYTFSPAQVGIGTTTPSSHAVLELRSPGNNQGFLVTRLTTAQRTALSLGSNENGMLVYDSDDNKFYYWHTDQWLPIRHGTDVALQAGSGIDITGNTISVVPDGDGDAGNEIQDLQLSGNTLTITNNASATPIDLAPFAGTNTDNQTLSFNATTGVLGITGGNTVTVTPTGTAGGILSGAYPNPALATSAGNAIVSALNNISTTSLLQANKLEGTVVLQGESPAGGVISGSFGGGLQINNLAVTTAKIADGAITAPKILDGSIPSAKLTTTGVTANTYGSQSVVPQLSVDAQGRITSVTPVNITGILPGGSASGDLSGTYPNPSIAATAGNNIVTAINNAGTTGAIATNRLGSAVVLDSETPTASDIAGTFASGLSINANAVTTTKVIDGAVTTAKIGDLQVTTAKIANGAITNAKILDGEVTPAKVAPGAAGQVLTTNLSGATVWAAPVSGGTGTVTSITAGTGLTGGTITGIGTIGLANTTVTAGTYGTSTVIPRITVDAQGRLTDVTTVSVSTGGVEGLAETLATGPDAGGGIAYNLSSVSIGDWTKVEGPGALNVNGSHFRSFTMFDDGYVIQPQDYILIANPGKPATIDLPKASENQGRILIFKSMGASTAEGVQVIAPEGLDGAGASEVLYMDPTGGNIAFSITVLCTGTTWVMINRAISPPNFKG